MHQITSHKVAGNEKNELFIAVTDAPDPQGGAHHDYHVYTTPDPHGTQYCESIVEIHFQNGPIPANGINGVTNEVLLALVKDRLECFQAGKFACAENEAALAYVTEALEILKGRTRDRIARQVEGQYKV